VESIPFIPDKLNREQRTTILQEVQRQVREAVIKVVEGLLSAFLEAELTAKLGRAKGELRVVGAERVIDWQCKKCGCNNAHEFIRDGHYRRSLQTGFGALDEVRVPMIECQRCGHDVVAQWAILEKFKRFWFDLGHQALFASGLCQSLRQLAQAWSAVLEGSVGLRTIDERINQLEAVLETAHHEAITDVPAILHLDGIWISLQTQEDAPTTVKVDKLGRKRHQRQGLRMVVLVALGLWSDGSGKRQILDWQLAESEEGSAWQTFLTRLYERGMRSEHGLQVIVRDGRGGLGEAIQTVYGYSVADQRCIFHKLKNVSDHCSATLSAQQKKDLIGQAKGIYQADTAEQARQRALAWADKWRDLAPSAVTALEREFEQTLVYYRLPPQVAKLARTTSLLERTNRELRRKFRQVAVFGSKKGANVAVYLQVQRLNAWWSNTSWWDASQALFFSLLAFLHP